MVIDMLKLVLDEVNWEEILSSMVGRGNYTLEDIELDGWHTLDVANDEGYIYSASNS